MKLFCQSFIHLITILSTFNVSIKLIVYGVTG